MENDYRDFWKKYEMIASLKDYAPIKRKYKKCRFCNKTEEQTTFNQKTHLLPELLGENDVITFNECDNCNQLFSKYESHLATFIRPYITLLGIKGKKKIPEFHSRTLNNDEETRTILKHTKDKKNQFILNNIDDYELNEEEKTASFIFRKAPFIPVYVYKAFLKIGLSLLPEHECKAHQFSFDWLIDKENKIAFYPTAFNTTLSGTYFSQPLAQLFKAKKIVLGDKEILEYTLILGFANQVFQIFLPYTPNFFEHHDNKRSLALTLFPSFVFDDWESLTAVYINQFDLRSTIPIKQDHKMKFTYTELERTITKQK